jgi:uncharacterized protein (DUF1778 family)
VETNVSNAGIVDAMSGKPVKTVPIYARVPAPDVALIDKAAKASYISRSQMVARIVREWAVKQERRK